MTRTPNQPHTSASAPPGSEKLKVFISYSRQEIEFVDRLQSILIERGVTAYLDREDIEKGEEWWARIQQLITDADTIVFVLSPASVGSAVCQQEVDFAESLNKRFVPIVARDLAGHAVPDALARLNYVFFIENRGAGASGDFDEAVAGLVRALETDIPWIREHTRLGALAQRWEQRRRPGEALLLGTDLSAAETWLTTRPKNAPNPTDAHRAFITESRRAATRRQRTTVAVSFVVVVVALSLAGIAYWQRDVAFRELARALRTQSLLLANRAQEEIKAGDPVTAMLSALEGLRDETASTTTGRTRPYVPFAELTLYQALQQKREEFVLKGHRDRVWRLAVNASGTRIATGSIDGSARLWDGKTGREIAVLQHKNVIFNVRFSPDDRYVVTASGDGTAGVWDANSGKKVTLFKGNRSVVEDASLSGDGTRLVTATRDNLARIWDVQSAAPLVELAGHKGFVSSAIFNPEGTRVLTTSRDGTARLWDAKTGDQLASFAQTGGDITTCTPKFFANATRIATCAPDNTVRIWDAKTFAAVGVISGQEGRLISLEFNRQGKKILTTADDNTVRVWDLQTGKLLGVLRHESRIWDAGFDASGDKIVTASMDKTVRIWSVTSGKLLQVLRGHRWGVHAAAFLGESNRIVTASTDTTARIWDLQPEEPFRVIEGDEKAFSLIRSNPEGTEFILSSSLGRVGEVEIRSFETGDKIGRIWAMGSYPGSIAYSPTGKRMAAMAGRDAAMLWDARTHQQMRPISNPQALMHPPDPPAPLQQLYFNPSGDRLLTTGVKLGRVWDVETGKQLVVLRGHEDLITSATYNRDGTRILTTSRDKTARVWDARTGKELAVLKGHKDVVSCGAFSTDGTRIVTGSGTLHHANDFTARIWDADSGAPLAVLKGHVDRIGFVEFSPDDRWVLTGSADHTARLWDAQTGAELLVLLGHQSALVTAAFSRDGNRIFTASAFHGVRIYDARTGQPVAILEGHKDLVTDAAINPQGTRVVTASLDKTARLWRVFPTTQALIDYSKSMVQRCLTPEQRRAFALQPEPPRWCIEKEKWPYHRKAWKDWLAAKDAGRNLPLPSRLGKRGTGILYNPN